MSYYNPFREIVKRFRESREIPQPVPDVSDEDVARVVRRDFPGQYDSVIAFLNEYGKEKWERGQVRVRLAALKLSQGDLSRLRREVERAKKDYRDVLAAAEYPQYFRTGGMRRLSRTEKQRIFNQDWEQYESWLRR